MLCLPLRYINVLSTCVIWALHQHLREITQQCRLVNSSLCVASSSDSPLVVSAPLIFHAHTCTVVSMSTGLWKVNIHCHLSLPLLLPQINSIAVFCCKSELGTCQWPLFGGQTYQEYHTQFHHEDQKALSDIFIMSLSLSCCGWRSPKEKTAVGGMTSFSKSVHHIENTSDFTTTTAGDITTLKRCSWPES